MNIKNKTLNIGLFILGITLFLRFISLFILELGDTTEARYAGMGMRMAINNNFLIPEIKPSIPFLGKPPLAFWITGISFKIFGLNEFAARLPHFLSSLILLIFVFFSLKKFINKQFAAIATIILGTTPIFISIAGYVMTESILILFTSIATISSWAILERNATKKWSYLFFISLGFIMLTKGPIGIVMVCFPLSIYLIVSKKWLFFFKNFDVFRGSLLSLLIFLPWYIAAEIKNPGFLEYFIIGEHISRFLIKGWSGDKYGTVHHETYGMIWIFFSIGVFPWIFIFIYRIKEKIKSKIKTDNLLFFAPFMIFPLLFFTFTHGIVFAYIAFSIVPFSIIITEFIILKKLNKYIFLGFSSISGLLIMIFLYLYVNEKIPWKLSDKSLIEYAIKNKKEKIFYLANKDIKFSSAFYSKDNKEVEIVTISDGLLPYDEEIKSIGYGNLILLEIYDLKHINDNKLKNKLIKKKCNRNGSRCLYEYKK